MEQEEYKIYQRYVKKCNELNREYNIYQIDDEDYITKEGVDMGEEFDIKFKKIHELFIKNLKKFRDQKGLKNT